MCTGIPAWFKNLPLLLPVYVLPCPLQEAAAALQEEITALFHGPKPCQLQQMALFHSGMAGKLDMCFSARCTGGLVTSGKGQGVAAWGLLVQQVSS